MLSPQEMALVANLYLKAAGISKREGDFMKMLECIRSIQPIDLRTKVRILNLILVLVLFFRS